MIDIVILKKWLIHYQISKFHKLERGGTSALGTLVLPTFDISVEETFVGNRQGFPDLLINNTTDSDVPTHNAHKRYISPEGVKNSDNSCYESLIVM